MSPYRASMYKGSMTVVLVLLLLTAFCLANVEPGTGPYYLCLFSLMIDIPFFLFLLYKLIRDVKKLEKAREEILQDSPASADEQ